MNRSMERDRVGDRSACIALTDQGDISRFLVVLFLRLAAVAFAVALAALGHGVSSKDGVEISTTIHQAIETDAEK